MKKFALAALLLTASLPAWSQSEEEPLPVEVVNSRPSSVWVVPGGKADVVRLYGRGFELVRSVNVQRGGARVPAVSARLKSVSRGMADLEVRAAANAEPGDDYRLYFVTGKAPVPVELKVEVVNPQQ